MERKSFKLDSKYGPSIVIKRLAESEKELNKRGICILRYNPPHPRELSMDEAIYLFHEAGAAIILEMIHHPTNKFYSYIVEGPEGSASKAETSLDELLKHMNLGGIE